MATTVKSKYNLMSKADWDIFKEMGLERAIHTIFTISEYNRTSVKPLLIPGSYIRPEGERPIWQSPTELPGTTLDDDSDFLLPPGKTPSQAYHLMTELIPFVDRLSFDGYIIAGGAALRTVVGFYDYGQHIDADFYPLYSNTALMSNEDRHARIMVSYERWLHDCQEALLGFKLNTVSICRGEHTSTLRLTKPPTNADSFIKTYQIIHRAYQSPEEVIVGFDQPCCKAFYDGTETYLTLDCALCIHYNINPIDWRAESPTHIKRALKYFGRCFRWVTPKLDLKPATAYRFAGGMISHQEDGEIRLHGQKYSDLSVINNGEFPVPKHQSAYQSDYEPRFIDRHITNSYNLPTEEEPESYYHVNMPFNNLRAAATNNPTYFVAYSRTIQDFLESKFVIDNFEIMIERQGYQEYYMHRKRMMEISREVNKIQDRIQTPKTKKNSRFMHAGMDASKPHRFRIEEGNRYIELCTEAKILSSQYKSISIANRHAMLERRETIKFVFENPGAQITASFHPIKRASPADYWGVNARPITYQKIAWDKIMTILLLMKRKIIPEIPRDLLKILRNLLYDNYMKSFSRFLVPET